MSTNTSSSLRTSLVASNVPHKVSCFGPKSLIRSLLRWYQRRVCRLEYERQTLSRFNERPVEFAFVFKNLAATYPREILDVGCGTTALPHLMRNCGFLVTATDNVRDYWPSGMLNRHYHIIDDDITATRIQKRFDFITCISVLEHIQKADAAVQNMFSLLTPKGHLVLTFPYNERTYVRNVYELPGSSYGQDASYITQAYSKAQLSKWTEENDAVVRDLEYWQFWKGDYWTVGTQIVPPRRVSAQDKHHLLCALFQRKG